LHFHPQICIKRRCVILSGCLHKGERPALVSVVAESRTPFPLKDAERTVTTSFVQEFSKAFNADLSLLALLFLFSV